MKEALIAAVGWWEAVEAVRNDSGREVVFGRDYQPSWLEQAQRALNTEEAMTYTVTRSSKTHGNNEIGSYEDFETAEAAARKAGAVGQPQKTGRDYVYDVDGHEGDDGHGIWIEMSR